MGSYKRKKRRIGISPSLCMLFTWLVILALAIVASDAADKHWQYQIDMVKSCPKASETEK